MPSSIVSRSSSSSSSEPASCFASWSASDTGSEVSAACKMSANDRFACSRMSMSSCRATAEALKSWLRSSTPFSMVCLARWKLPVPFREPSLMIAKRNH
ncbi:hypothetical protein VTJ83DRAFT_2520 [Remersonia thermophila]|uniref:Secreted protein n=1 Tax=Remersonia thermophila TaxID=72144 RepID=A0ABR4DKG2_9PEZI